MGELKFVRDVAEENSFWPDTKPDNTRVPSG